MRPGDAEAGIERWCERFSANLLMPREALAKIEAEQAMPDPPAPPTNDPPPEDLDEDYDPTGEGVCRSYFRYGE